MFYLPKLLSLLTFPSAHTAADLFTRPYRIVYVFIGSIILTENWYNYVAGAVVGVVGVVYVVLEFIPQIEPPGNMKEAEQGWGAEQV